MSINQITGLPHVMGSQVNALQNNDEDSHAIEILDGELEKISEPRTWTLGLSSSNMTAVITALFVVAVFSTILGITVYQYEGALDACKETIGAISANITQSINATRALEACNETLSGVPAYVSQALESCAESSSTVCNQQAGKLWSSGSDALRFFYEPAKYGIESVTRAAMEQFASLHLTGDQMAAAWQAVNEAASEQIFNLDRYLETNQFHLSQDLTDATLACAPRHYA